jgi:hypothetical protein
MGKRSNGAGWFAFAWSLLVTFGLLFFPLYGGSTSTRNAEGASATLGAEVWGEGTLLSVAGAPALVFIMLPLLASLAPLVAPRARRYRATVIATIAVTVLVLLAVMTLGLLHVPTAIALVVASGRARNDEHSLLIQTEPKE